MMVRFFAVATVFLGIAGIVGWQLGDSDVSRLLTGQPVIAPNSAALFVIMGSCLFAAGRSSPVSRRAVLILASLAIAVSAARLLEFALGKDFGVDSLLLKIPRTDEAGEAIGTMSFPAAACFLLSAVTMTTFAATSDGRSSWAAVKAMGAGVVGVGLVFALGYAYGSPLTFQGHRVAISLNVAIGLMLMGVSMVTLIEGLERAERASLVSRLQEAHTRQEQRVLERTTELTATVQALEVESGERKRIQDQLFHEQKMESVGRLAGGIAHDFNNLLSVIHGCLAIAERTAAGDTRFAEPFRGIEEAATRAAELSRRLLVIAHRQVIDLRAINLSSVLGAFSKVLRPVLGEQVEVKMTANPDLWPVQADPGQIEQVVLNLAVNARDAMPDGGSITLSARNTSIGQPVPAVPNEVRPGDYVVLEVKDTGSGMSADVRSHLFEPFFTTKPAGIGTGLGLATCYGIVKQHHGHIVVNTGPGEGTLFSIFLPRAPAARAQASIPGPRRSLPTKLLVVDDQPTVLAIAAQALKQNGCDVVTASTGDEALEKLRADPAIDFVLSDVVIPGLSGVDVVREAQSIRPGIKTMLMSGRRPDLPEGITAAFMQKPFMIGQLVERIRDVFSAA